MSKKQAYGGRRWVLGGSSGTQERWLFAPCLPSSCLGVSVRAAWQLHHHTLPSGYSTINELRGLCKLPPWLAYFTLIPPIVPSLREAYGSDFSTDPPGTWTPGPSSLSETE